MRHREAPLILPWALLAGASGCSDYGFTKPDTTSETPVETAGPTDVPAPETEETGDSGDSGDTEAVEPPAEPDIEVAPLLIDHGVVEAGALLVGVVEIGNVGTAPLTLIALRADPALVVAPDAAGTSLVPGGSVAVNLTTVATLGAHVEHLWVDSDDPDEPSVEVTVTYEVEDPCSWDDWVPDDCDGPWGGSGADGAATLGGSFAPPRSALIADAAGGALPVADPSAFAVDDELFVLADDGAWALTRVVAPGPTVDPAVTAPAGALVQRVPHYRDSVVAAPHTGDVIVFRVCGALDVAEPISATGLGWAGGRATSVALERGWQGASASGPGAQSVAANGLGGGGGSGVCNGHADGGGGGHATAGAVGGFHACMHSVPHHTVFRIGANAGGQSPGGGGMYDFVNATRRSWRHNGGIFYPNDRQQDPHHRELGDGPEPGRGRWSVPNARPSHAGGQSGHAGYAVARALRVQGAELVQAVGGHVDRPRHDRERADRGRLVLAIRTLGGVGGRRGPGGGARPRGEGVDGGGLRSPARSERR